MSEEIVYVCPIDGAELTEQNWDLDCPVCGHEFEDGDGAITKEHYELLQGDIKFICKAVNNHDKLVEALADLVKSFDLEEVETVLGVPAADAIRKATVILTEVKK